MSHRLALVMSGLLALAGCSSAKTQLSSEACRIGAFRGDWVSVERPGARVSVSDAEVDVTWGAGHSHIGYVVRRDFGPVTRQVLRQEFGNLTALGMLPATARELGEIRCALELIRPEGAAALVEDPGRGLVLLQETDGSAPSAIMRLHRIDRRSGRTD